MLEKLLESLDKEVYTEEIVESIKTQFNEAVETKAKEIADAAISEETLKLEASFAEKIEEKLNELDEKSDEYKNELDEKSAEFIEEKMTSILDNVDKYLDRIIEEFVTESKEKLDESLKSEKSDMIIEAFDAMLIAGAVDISKIVEAKNETDVEIKLKESIEKYDELVEENILLKDKNKELLKSGVILELKEGLSLVESEKFEKLANLVEFSETKSYIEKLETIKESVAKVNTEIDNKIDESVKNDDKKNFEKPIWAHLA